MDPNNITSESIGTSLKKGLIFFLRAVLFLAGIGSVVLSIWFPDNLYAFLLFFLLGCLLIFLSWRAKRGPILWIIILLVIAGVLVSIILASLDRRGKGHGDARRITAIKQIQLALELYFDKHNQYPLAYTKCDPTKKAYFGLEVLQMEGFIPGVPYDRLSTPQRPICYKYATPSTATTTTYHLGATLDYADNPGLNSDQDCNSTIAGDCVPGTAPYINGFDGKNDRKNRIYDVTP